MKGATVSDRAIAPPPEAVLIALARKARNLTIVDAANLSGVIKSSRWGQIESGYVMRQGTPVRTEAQDMDLARMAHVVGVTPDELRSAGRSDAAEILDRIRLQAERDDTDRRPGESSTDWAFRLMRELREEAEKDPSKRRALEAMRDSWRGKDAG